jgi:RND superfamily putative drug exporter
MLALTVFAQRFLVSMGIGGALVALVAATVALTLLPALLRIFGTRLRTRRPPRAPETSRWAAVARAAMRRPGLVTTVTVLGMVLVAVPALRTQWVGVDASVLPTSQSARVVADRLAADFGGLDDETVVLVASAPTGDAQAVDAYAQRVGRADGVVRVDRPQRLVDGAWRIDATVPGPPSGERAQDALAAVRAVPAPFPVAAGGRVAETDDLQSSIAGRAWIAGTVLAVGTLVLLWLMTGSVVLGLQALVINLLTLGVATGVVVLVFQDARLEGLLGYTSQGGLELSNFLVFAAIAFALSTDYGVMLLGRIKEARDAGLDDRAAVERGVGATGGLISAAAVLLAVALGAFVLARVVFLKEIGVAAVVAVLVDAFLVRALLVPSLMALLRGWNWWSPPALRRLHARIGLAHG